ncbi:MAG: hypothetical protein N3A01_09910, partial [Bacteroidales bacterium]|nr:hypothetical protein [Bacteroidales bacterium]
YKNGKKGFDVTIAAPALEKATKHFNQIYSFGNDSWLYLNDATSVFCSRQMFNEMKTNKKVTFYPYANEKTAGNPVTLEYKESKTVCVKQNNAFIGLPCLVFEAATGERLVVLDNQQYPLIVQMQLTFKIFLKSIE